MADPRILPSIGQLIERQTIQLLLGKYGRTATLEALRLETEELRTKLVSTTDSLSTSISNMTAAMEYLEESTRSRLTDWFAPSLRQVINATGVILHTNLGRAPLTTSAVQQIAETAGGYVNLEYDLSHGKRSQRDSHIDSLVQRLTGAEATAVVNNNAAATLLMLSALASGREVIVSRGELVEIGGGFRVPEIMSASGAVLREVGTTNKTRVADYAAAITEKTALLLRVHPSNFRIHGFTDRPTIDELVSLGKRFNITVAEDLGSGYLGNDTDSENQQLAEPTVRKSVAVGIDVVCFSADKLLGGPQAGILVGQSEKIERIRAHPLMRALRVDKLTYAALGATLQEHAAGQAHVTVPVSIMLSTPVEEIEKRAQTVVDAIENRNARVEILNDHSAIGGGSAPETHLPTKVIAIQSANRSATYIQTALRKCDPPVIGRIDQDRVLLDLRTVLPEQDKTLMKALSDLLSSC